MPLSDSFVLSSFLPSATVKPGSFVDQLFERFDSFPDHKIAVLDGASEESYTFKRLKRLTEQVASALAKRGFVKGDVLSLFSHNCLENAPITFGAIVAGGTVHLVKPLASPQELRFHFDLVRPKVIVTSAAAAQNVLDAASSDGKHQSDVYVIGGAVDGCRRAEELLEDPGDANPWGRIELKPREDIALMIHTGGTTGMSKTVMITHEAAKRAIVEFTSLEPEASGDDLCLGYIPFSHVFSFILFYGAWLRLGCTVVNVNSYDSEIQLKAIEKHKITRMGITPTALLTLITSPSFDKTDLSSILTVRCGGAAMSGESEKYLRASLLKAAPKVDFTQAYGMTELCGTATAFPPISHERFKQKLGSVGVLKSDVEMQVISCDDQQRPCQPGQMGQIILRSSRFMMGYFKNEEATKKALHDGWFYTGDFGYFDEDEYVYAIDRVEDLVRHKHSIAIPTRIEGVLRAHPGVKDCAVVGRSAEPDEGEKAAAFVVRREACDVTEEEVRRFAAERLAPHEQLTGGVRFVQHLPKSPAGKMLRRELKKQLEGL